VVVSYLTLRPRAGAALQTSEITAAGEVEAIGESLGELVSPDSRP
jgi:hypothetical protein